MSFSPSCRTSYSQRLWSTATDSWWQNLLDQLPTLFLLLIPVSFAFAITKHHLMDIHLVIRNTLIYGAVTGMVGLASLILAGTLSLLFGRLSESPSQWVTVGTTLGAAMLIVPARGRVQAMVDRRFFRHQHNYPAALRLLGREVLESNDRRRLLDVVADRLLEALHNRSVVIFLKRPEDRAFVPAAQAGLPEEIVRPLKYAANSVLPARLGQMAAPADLDLPEAVQDSLAALRCGFLVPVRKSGELMAFFALGTKLSDEEYDQPDREFLGGAADHVAVGLDNLQLAEQQRESDRAREIQQAFLPKQIPVCPGFSISGAWQPARAVGGDYYDVLALSGGKIGLVIADVSGKGVPAALLMSNLQATVKAFCTDDIPPRILCEKVNAMICGNVSPGKFITFFYAVVDPGARKLSYANAGHNAPLLLREDGTLLRLEQGGAVLGVFRHLPYEQEEVEIRRGDRLLLFTDGVSEAFNEADEEFGEERLVELLRNHVALDATGLQQTVLRSVTEFCSGNFHDDATLIAFMVLE